MDDGHPKLPATQAPANKVRTGNAQVFKVAGSSSETPASPQVLIEPPKRSDKITSWLLLILCLALSATVMLVDLGKPDVVDLEEARSLATSAETWHRRTQAGDTYSLAIDKAVPYLNGVPQIQRPPGVSWFQLAAFTWPTKTPLTADDMVRRARVVSVVLALAALATVFWAGLSIGGSTTALLATLILGTNPLFLLHARLASNTIHHFGWVLMSISTALWAIRPFKPLPSLPRQAIGWGTSGVFLGIAILTTGLTAAVEICLPIALMLVLCERRFSRAIGLLAALFIGLQMALPWVAYVHGHDPDIWEKWLREIKPAFGFTSASGDTGTSLIIFVGFAVALPWLLWLVAAAAQLFTATLAPQRKRMFLCWTWLITVVLVGLFLAGVNGAGKVLVVLPPFAVLIGLLLHQYADHAPDGQRPRLWPVLSWSHSVILIIASIVWPVGLWGQGSLVDRGILDHPLTSDVTWSYAIGMASALLSVALLSACWVVRYNPRRAAIAWAAWMFVAICFLTMPILHSPMTINPVRQDAVHLVEQIDDKPIYHLSSLRHDLLFYFGRSITPITQEALQEATSISDHFYLLAPASPKPGVELEFVTQLSHTGMKLWEFSPSQ